MQELRLNKNIFIINLITTGSVGFATAISLNTIVLDKLFTALTQSVFVAAMGIAFERNIPSANQ